MEQPQYKARVARVTSLNLLHKGLNFKINARYLFNLYFFKFGRNNHKK